jgi:hypothetical protein
MDVLLEDPGLFSRPPPPSARWAWPSFHTHLPPPRTRFITYYVMGAVPAN